ncbi:SLC12A7 [Symbiodinium sp. KB8]|nr:SLC12A7 [Symbiodinium sp. KB8]
MAVRFRPSAIGDQQVLTMEGDLADAVTEAIEPVQHLEKEWEPAKLCKRLRDYFKKAAKSLEFKDRSWMGLVNDFADSAFSSIFQAIGDRRWLDRVDFVFVLDAGIKEFFPRHVLEDVPQKDLERLVLAAHDRAFEEQRYLPKLWDFLDSMGLSGKTRKKAYDSIDEGRKVALKYMRDPSAPDEVKAFVSRWVDSTVKHLHRFTQGEPESVLDESQAAHVFERLLKAIGRFTAQSPTDTEGLEQLVLEGVDQDKHLWHGREAAAATVHNYAADMQGAVRGTLGVVQGVIFPCMGNILGVILFLRGPWIVGKGGILEAFGVGLVCCTCTFLTTLSLSAIATNGKIAGGGAYYLISRSLGPALGAGVGLCFYMANSIGAAMYFMGCVEAWEIAQPEYQIGEIGDLNNVRLTGYLILVFAVVIIFGGIKYVSRLGTVFLMVVLFVILCMYVGCLMGPNETRPATFAVDLVTADGSTVQKTLSWTGPSGTSFSDNWASAWDAPQGAFPKDTTQYSFVNMMGLYFPSVTGIMAGANRSADLMDPTSAIPKGTLFAQLSTSFIYLSFIFVFGSVAPRETLLNDKFFAATSAFPFKEIVIYGVMASSLGAGLNSLVSGTKLLSAIAGDGTLPILRFFRAAPGKEPRLALLASGALCALSITIGELNAIAPLLTMFFLMCYTCVNMSCTILHFVSDPNWRPTFRYHHWSISLVAAALCVWMMFAMAAVIAMAAIIFCGLILAYAAYNSANTRWGDGFQGMKFQLAKNILISMDAKLHTKNWRPQLLVVTEPKMRPLSSLEGSALLFPDLGILKIASQLKNGRGFIVLGGICCPKGPEKLLSQGGLFLSEKMSDQVAESHFEVKELLRKYMIDGFGKIVYSEDFTTALTGLVQSSGLGAFEPNCVLASWPKDALEPGRAGVNTRSKLVNMVQISAIFQKVMILTKGEEWPEFDARITGTIDIWWIVGDGGVLLLLPCLLKKHRVWSGCRIRLFVLADRAGDDVDLMQRELDMYVRDFRLNVEVHIKVVDEVVESGMSPRVAADAQRFFVDQPPDDVVPSEYEELEAGMRNRREHPKAEQFDQPTRVTSGQSLTDTLKTWRGRQFQRERSFDSRVSGGSGGENSKSINSHTWSAMQGRKQFPERLKEWNTPQDNLAMNSMTDPGPGPQAVGKATARPSVDQLNFTDDRQTPHSNALVSDISGSNFQRQVSADGKRTLFLHDARQLAATSPCSPDELSVVSTLNKVILEESQEADLVCTNLPDMPPSDSALGYCQLVEAMTANMKRVILVRGTSSEVITAFT